MTKTAVVVGGSLAGLMHGIILKKSGFEVHVLERSALEVLESQAAELRVGPEVYDFIQEHVDVRPPSRYSSITYIVEIMDGEGHVMQTIPPQQPLRLTTWKIVHDLLKCALLEDGDGSEGATYRTDHVAHDLEEIGEKVKVSYVDLKTDTPGSMESDLVVAADGAHSVIRRKFCPGVVPQYAGYVTWRGRVPELAVPARTRAVLRDRCVLLRVEEGFQTSYYVRRDNASTSIARDFVWIWYDNIPASSQQLIETLTDINGKPYQATIPRGKMDPKVWQRVLDRKSTVKNPYFIDLMEAIEEPFVSAINDFAGQQSVFWDGKVILVGDAFSLIRPHGGGSMSQAALQAQMLLRVMKGEITLEEWEERCVEEAERLRGLV